MYCLILIAGNVDEETIENRIIAIRFKVERDITMEYKYQLIDLILSKSGRLMDLNGS